MESDIDMEIIVKVVSVVECALKVAFAFVDDIDFGVGVVGFLEC